MATSLRSSLLSGTRSANSSTPGLQITLRDNTRPPSDPRGSPTPPPSDDGGSPRSSGILSGARRNGAGKRETLRKAIAQRKYRRWELGPDEGASEDDDDDGVALPDPKAGGVVVEREQGAQEEGEGEGEGEEEEEEEEDSIYRGRRKTRGSDEEEAGEDGGPGPSGARCDTSDCDGGVSLYVGGVVQKPKRQRKNEVSEIDVLYENQRGVFACGIPLFSSRGLLNFDPAPWQNGHLHDSAVSIVNAQVPDPSWVWDWKTWYVDMTSDVDEEGWTYSFSFSPFFSWHGTHVWFHSFVRRRRWLRKRIKLSSSSNNNKNGTSNSSSPEPHHLTHDYFTIHSRLAPGASSHVVGGGTSSDTSSEADAMDDDDAVTDIPSLLRTLRRCRLDREKVGTVMRFVDRAADEVAYLPPHAPDILRNLIFQASRRDLLSRLVGVLNQEERTRAAMGVDPKEEKKEKEEKEEDAEARAQRRKRRMDGLRAVVAIADEEVRKLEYWSDIKAVAKESQTEEMTLGGPRIKGKQPER